MLGEKSEVFYYYVVRFMKSQMMEKDKIMDTNKKENGKTAKKKLAEYVEEDLRN